METKTVRKNSKNLNKMKSIRLKPDTFVKADGLLKKANNKKTGGKIKFDQMLNLALDLINDEHIKLLQDRSLKNSDRQELLRKKYSELYGTVTEEQFIGITMTPAYFDFLKEHGQALSL